MRLLFLIAVLSLTGCKKRVGSPDFGSVPHLPAPTAGTYATVASPPADPVVAALAPPKLRWEASLTGAAAGLALGAVEGSGGLRRFEVREAVWQAGYPYPARAVRGWSVTQGAAPPDEVRDWLAADPEAHYGLVRARSSRGDAWVGLTARPRIALGVLPRTVEVGGRITLPAVADATLRVCDPAGKLHESQLSDGRALTLSLPGEWLFEVRDIEGVAALFPVYVGVDAPSEPVLSSPEAMPVDEEALLKHVRAQITQIRRTYELEPFTADLLLEQSAHEALAGKAPDAGKLRARVLTCSGETVEDCLDRLLWDLDSRAALIDPKVTFSGTAVVADMDGIRISLLLAG